MNLNLAIDPNIYKDFEYNGDMFRVLCFVRSKSQQDNKDVNSYGNFFTNEFSYEIIVFAQNLTRNCVYEFPLYLLNRNEKLKLKEEK